MTPIAQDFKLPEDGWIHLVPVGEYPRRVRQPDGSVRQVVQVLDAEAIASMVDAFAAPAADPNFAGVLIDYDHGSLHAGASSEAAGWILAVESRADGLFGRVRWSDLGAAAVQGGRYRYISPVWLIPQMQHLGGDRYRPAALTRAAVTNDPWFDLHMQPIAHNAGGDPPANSTPKDPHMDALKQLLGLPADASDDAVLAAVKALMPQPEDADAIASRQAAEAQADADLRDFEPIVKDFADADRSALRDALIANRAVTRAGLILLGRRLDDRVDPARNALPHRRAADPANPTDDDLKAEFAANSKLQAEFAPAGGQDAYLAFRRAEIARAQR